MEIEWLMGLLKIILVNIVLSGDNAVVIAMACRNLKPEQQKKAIFWGTFGAVILRLALTLVAVYLLRIPLVEAIGGLLLLYIAVKLLANDDDEEKESPGFTMGQAIKTIVIADVIMSLDNVVAVAASANGDWLLIGIGLAVSIPLIVWCSQLLTNLMKRFPIIVWLGAGLLGYTAGELLLRDAWVRRWLQAWLSDLLFLIPIVLTVAVVAYGLVSANRVRRSRMNH
jgi:YjbE family integral membrane protein